MVFRKRFSVKPGTTGLMVCALCMMSHLALAGSSKTDELPDPKVLLQKIKDNGADAVYKSELDGQKWLSFLRKVETGKRQ